VLTPLARPPMAKKKPKKVDLVYNREYVGICPECFSLPDRKRRAELEASGERGWGLVMRGEPIKIQGTEYRVAETHYPCSNQACRTTLRADVLGPFMLREPMLVYLSCFKISDAMSSEYRTGKHDPNGIWRVKGKARVETTLEPEPVAKKAVRKRAKKKTPPKKRGKRK
jgi:hypothetical protein